MVTLYCLIAFVSYFLYSYLKRDKNNEKLIDKRTHRCIIILLVILFATSLSKGDEWMMAKQKEIIETMIQMFTENPQE